MKRGLTISGGGARGAWAVGVLKRLNETSDKWYNLVCGTSTGALVCPCAALREIDDIERFYVTAKKEELLQPRLLAEGPSALWAGVTGADSVYTTEGLRVKVDEMLSPERWKRLRAGSVKAVVCAVGLNSGQTHYYRSDECGRKEFTTGILMSASIPCMMPVVGNCVDGGVREILPLEYVVDHGCTEIDCIVLSPKKQAVKHTPTTLLGVLERTLGLLQAEILKNDLRVGRGFAMWLNTKIRMFRIPEFYCSALDFTPAKMRMMVDKGYEYASKHPNGEAWDVREGVDD